jgi:hypothetical protein
MAKKRILESGNGGRGMWAFIGAADGYRLDVVPEATPLVGFRAWSCDTNGTLKAVTMHWPWDRDGRPASCMSVQTRHRMKKLLYSYSGELEELGEHGESPCPECGCGFWAFREPIMDRYQRSMLMDWASQNGQFFVTGQVELWGRVVSHSDGFRAQFARPAGELTIEKASSYVSNVEQFVVDALERRYGLVVSTKF